MQQQIFGTDGIRDVANCGFLTPEFVLKLGKIIGFLLNKNPKIFSTNQLPPSLYKKKVRRQSNSPCVIIGRDTRISGQMIENACISGLTSQGINIIQMGVISTPALAYLARRNGAHLGIMISASHNPYDSNGIKILSSEGVKITDKTEHLIEKYLLSRSSRYAEAFKKQTGCIFNDSKKVQEYIKDISRNGFNLKGMKVVVDCANGATSFIAPEVFRRLGAKVIPIHHKPNGVNINYLCGSLYPQVARQAVLKHHAQIGLSLDGDGDRLILVDDKGNILDGDYILAILANHYKKHKQLTKNTAVATVMSNTGLEVFLRERDIKLIRTPVGDRNVAALMFKNGYILGGEQSGHIILLNRSVTGDGIITALEILKIIKQESKPISLLANCIKKYPQVLINLKVESKPELAKLKNYNKITNEIRHFLGSNSKVVIRYSGTEPLLRIMLEAENKQKIIMAGKKIIGFFRNTLKIKE